MVQKNPVVPQGQGSHENRHSFINQLHPEVDPQLAQR